MSYIWYDGSYSLYSFIFGGIVLENISGRLNHNSRILIGCRALNDQASLFAWFFASHIHLYIIVATTKLIASCLFDIFVLLLLLCNHVVFPLSLQVTSFSLNNNNSPSQLYQRMVSCTRCALVFLESMLNVDILLAVPVLLLLKVPWCNG